MDSGAVARACRGAGIEWVAGRGVLPPARAACEAPSAPKKQGHERKRPPLELPHFLPEHSVADADKVCAECGGEKKRIGEKISEQLEYALASLFVIDHIQPVYVCPCCQEGVVAAMKQRVLESKAIHTDDAPVTACTPGEKGTHKSRFWVYLGDAAHPYTVYDYTPSRKRDGPAAFLEGFFGSQEHPLTGPSSGCHVISPRCQTIKDMEGLFRYRKPAAVSYVLHVVVKKQHQSLLVPPKQIVVALNEHRNSRLESCLFNVISADERFR